MDTLLCNLFALIRREFLLPGTACLLLLPPAPATAQGRPSPAAPGAILLALREAAAGAPGAPGAGRVLALVSPVLALRDGDASAAELALFDRVPLDPKDSKDILAVRAENIFDQAKLLEKDIEITHPIPTKAQKEAADAAMKLLYGDSKGEQRSAAYVRYLDFETTFLALHAQLKQSSNSAERTNLQTKIRITEQDWEAFGKRNEIKQAITTLARHSPAQLEKLRSNWKALLDAPMTRNPYPALWDQVASSADWTTVTTTLAATAPAVLSWQSGGQAGKTESMNVGGGLQVSFKMRTFQIPRGALVDHPFLQSPNWKNTKSFVLSDGTPQNNPAELVPRLVASLVLVKGVELNFSSMESWRAVSEVLAKSGSVTLGGIPLKGGKVASAYSSPRFISTPQPFVVGAIIHELPQVPLTDPNSTWLPWKN